MVGIASTLTCCMCVCDGMCVYEKGIKKGTYRGSRGAGDQCRELRREGGR